MASRQNIGPAQRMVSLAVLAALCALAAWILTTRAHLNPAVEVYLRAPAPKAGETLPGGAATAPGADSEPQGETRKSPEAGGLAALLPDAAPDQKGLRALAKAEIFNPATLSDKIDGKAELYLSAGFAAMACRAYQAGAAHVDVYIYRMKSPEAAFSVFGGQRRPGSAQSGLAKNAYLTENALFFTNGRDYVEVIADRAGVKPVLEALAKAVLAGLAPEGGEKKAAQAQPQELFPKAGIKADSMRLAVEDAFGCQGFTNVYSVEYDATAGGSTAFLSRRKTPAEAEAIAKTYARFLTDNGYAPQEVAGAPQGARIFGMEGSVEIVMTRGNLLAGVHDAPDQASALKLARALAGALDAAPQSKGGK